MGSTQSKIKEGYALKMAPMFESKVNQGQSPYSNLNKKQVHQLKESITQPTGIPGQDDPSMRLNPYIKKIQVKWTDVKFNSQSYPYSAVGLIISYIDGQEMNRSGTIVGKKHVLTCAHNCYSMKDHKPVESLHFYPSYFSSKSGPCYRSKAIHIPLSFQNSMMDKSQIDNTIANDYAVIELDTDDNLQSAYGSLGVDFSEELYSNEKQIIGYSKKQQDIDACRQSFIGQSRLEHGLIKYDMPADKGMAGSPIIEQINGYYYIIGLHVYSLQIGLSRQRGGLKLGRKAFENVQKWMMQEVETVDLKQKSFGKEGLKYISKHSWKKLAHLTLIKCNLFSNCAQYLRKGNWGHLTHLDLGGNRLSKEGVHEFSQGNYPNLKSLSLWGNNICKGGAYYLMMAGLDRLQYLNLYHNRLGSQGLQNLCEGKWIHLSSLHIGNNQIYFESLDHILNTCWTNLEALNLWGNGLEEQRFLIKSLLQLKFKRFKSLTI